MAAPSHPRLCGETLPWKGYIVNLISPIPACVGKPLCGLLLAIQRLAQSPLAWGKLPMLSNCPRKRSVNPRLRGETDAQPQPAGEIPRPIPTRVGKTSSGNSRELALKVNPHTVSEKLPRHQAANFTL